MPPYQTHLPTTWRSVPATNPPFHLPQYSSRVAVPPPPPVTAVLPHLFRSHTRVDQWRIIAFMEYSFPCPSFSPCSASGRYDALLCRARSFNVTCHTPLPHNTPGWLPKHTHTWPAPPRPPRAREQAAFCRTTLVWSLTPKIDRPTLTFLKFDMRQGAR